MLLQICFGALFVFLTAVKAQTTPPPTVKALTKAGKNNELLPFFFP